MPPVPYPQVIATMSRGVFNPVVYRPLFEHLGFVTCRTFETPAAGTIPLFLLEPDYVARDLRRARREELVLGEARCRTRRSSTCWTGPTTTPRSCIGIREEFRRRAQPRGAPARADRLSSRSEPSQAASDEEIAHRRTEQTAATPPAPQRMQLRYGFNEIDGWAAFSMGEHRRAIRRRLRLMGTKVVRVFVFDKPVPDPFREWHWFAAYVQAVLDTGAMPMITFAKFHPPLDDAGNIRKFVARCPRWSGAAWSSGAARRCATGTGASGTSPTTRRRRRRHLRAVPPHLRGGGRRPSWTCWSRTSAAARHASAGRPSTARSAPTGWTGSRSSLHDVDDRMLGFVNWHMYARLAAGGAERKPGVQAVGLLRIRRNGEVFKALADGADAAIRGARTGRRAARCTAATS